MIMKLSLLTLLSFIVLVGCDQFIESMNEGSKVQTFNHKKSDHFSILLSGNINGETHPCGCRHFPLGGMAQVYGLLNKLNQDKSILYIDTGDTLFDSPSLNDFNRKSKIFTAKQIIKNMNQLGLHFFVPGDQDFAPGIKTFEKLMEEAKFEILAANLKLSSKLRVVPWKSFQLGDRSLYLVGLVNPSLIRAPINTNQLQDPIKSIQKAISDIKAHGFKDNNPAHLLILASSGGHSFDQRIVNKFPEIDWVLGGHNQNFNKFPEVKGSTSFVQVLSRNHYLGELKIPYAPKDKPVYEVIEIRDELKDYLRPNPLLGELDQYKSELKKIQLEEEKSISFEVDDSIISPTASSCIQCHTEQADKWHTTSHSVAYTTLIRVNEEANSSCIECHSLYYKNKLGFHKTTEMIRFDDKADDKKQEDYWKAFKSQHSHLPELRKISKEKMSQLSKAWLVLDEKKKVSHNFANVQCLNCHAQSSDHPFEVNKADISEVAKKEKIKINCMNCHVPDQSPEWYSKDGRLNEDVFNSHYESIACPKVKK